MLQQEEKLDETPKILKNHRIYVNEEGNILSAYFIELLLNEKVLKEDASLAFFNEHKNMYVYGFNVPKSHL